MDDTVLSALSAVAKLHTTRAAHVGLNRDDLLAITRTGRDLVAHAEAELQRRLRFPSRLAPDLVLRFLDVPTIGASLAVSAGWGKTAEAVFQSVAADLGVTSIAEGQQWHDIVREQVSLRWVGATDDPDRCRFLSEFDGMELGTAKVTSPDSESGDTYVIGRGIRLRQGCERRWRIKMDKIPGIVDAVGWCLCSSCSSRTPLRACLWNSDGHGFNTYDWIHEPVFSDDPQYDQFGDHTLEVCVSYLNDSTRTLCTELRILSETPVRSQYALHGQHFADLRADLACQDGTRDLVVAPLVRIFDGSVATFV